jgi:hypothetical protein
MLPKVFSTLNATWVVFWNVIATGRSGYMVSPSFAIKIGSDGGHLVGLVVGGPVAAVRVGLLVGVEIGYKDGPSLGVRLGPSLGVRLGPSLGLRLGPSLGVTDGEGIGAALGFPHSTLTGSQGSSTRYAQNL